MQRAVPFNRDKLRTLMEDTLEIQKVLAMRRTTAAPAPQQTAPAEVEGLPELDANHRSVIGELLQRPSWSLTEVSTLTMRFGLMPLACIARINEWATQKFGDLLLDAEKHTVTLNLKVKGEIENERSTKH